MIVSIEQEELPASVEGKDALSILLGDGPELSEAYRAAEAEMEEARETLESLRDEWKAREARREECPKCGGRGTLDRYAHIANGKCFRCGGSGKAETPRPVPAPPASEIIVEAEEAYLNGAEG